MNRRDAARKKVEILLVEDSPTQAELLHEMLAENGYAVTVAHDGREALTFLQTRTPELIITDVVMPVMDGFELCRKVKSSEGLKEIPIVVMSSLSSPNDIMEGLSAGADNFIRKPCDEEYLLSRVEYILTNRKLRKSERTQFGAEIYFDGQRHFINSERQQILDVLMSTFEDAVRLNRELQTKQRELTDVNDRLEKLVEERTAALTEEIGERRKSEEARRESEGRYRMMFDNNPHPMWVYDVETLSVLAVNGTAVQQYGYSREEFLAMKVSDILLSDDMGTLDEAAAKLNFSFRESGVWKHLKKDGTFNYVEVDSRALPSERGATRLALIKDITERKKLEVQLRQTQKMEAIGRLAGGVAHDFNNLLTVINGYAQLMEGLLAEESPLRGSCREIVKAGERAAGLTQQLLAFSRRQVMAPRVLNLNEVVVNTEKMLRRLIGEDIQFLTVLHPEIGRVRADPGQIEQVIMNLVVNARDAMPQGGKLTIETGNAELDESYTRGHVTVKPGPYVMMAVTDTGCGMDASTLSHVFEPFFTTKAQGNGTGLGLATVYGIAKQSDGYIWVYSEPGRGTTFKLYLPQVSQPKESADTRRDVAEVKPHGTETILVAEDEDAVRALVCGVLESLGYTVLDANGPVNALREAEQFLDPIDLLLTDTIMPVMNGRQLAEQFASRHPESRALYMSGYTDKAIVHNGELDTGMAFLQKPFTPDALARKVREVLDEGRVEPSRNVAPKV